MPATMWERIRAGSKAGFDRSWQALDKLGAPVNRLSNKLGSEAFWPTTLDKESEKAARILKSFCKDGFYGEEEVQPIDGPKAKQRVLQKIPEKVIQNAKGLAIFTTMRTGLWMSGSGGSGVLVARLPDGSWSPPSGILMHTAGLGFMVGIDIYDCVIVINSEKALEAFTRIRCTLGAEMSVAAGPVGAGGILDTELHKRHAPIYTYLKSRGFYAGVQIDGTIVIERTDENERFYHERLSASDILSGKVRHPPFELQMLMETLKAAEGNKPYRASLVPSAPPPSDFEIDHGETFGVPDKDDPDPYGVLALEKEGMSLKEAGTSKRASWEQFTFNPSQRSPIHAIYARQDHAKASSSSRRSSWRTSAMSGESGRQSVSRQSSHERANVQMADGCTQTDFVDEKPPSPTYIGVNGPAFVGPHSRKASSTNLYQPPMQDVPEDSVLETVERKERPPMNLSVSQHVNGNLTPPSTPPPAKFSFEDVSIEKAEQPKDAVLIESAKEPEAIVSTENTVPTEKVEQPEKPLSIEVPEKPESAVSMKKDEEITGQENDEVVDEDRTQAERIGEDEDEVEESDEEDEEDEAQIIEAPAIQTLQHHALPSPTTISTAAPVSKPRLVTVPKRVAPRLPPRNPNRSTILASSSASAASSAITSPRTSVSLEHPFSDDDVDDDDVSHPRSSISHDDNVVSTPATPVAAEMQMEKLASRDSQLVDDVDRQHDTTKSQKQDETELHVPGGFD